MSTERTRIREHHARVSPEEMAPVPGGKSGALRAAIFGLNDGLVSNLSLIMGVAGSGFSREAILVAGIAGLLAGAFSMAAGEYVSMRAQRELFERLIAYEAQEIADDPEGETEELSRIYQGQGIPREIAQQAAEALHRDPAIALAVHAKEELGLDPDELGSPRAAATSSFLTFGAGAFVPLIPYLFATGVAAAVGAVALSLGSLFAAGASMTLFTGRRWWISGTRMFLIGGGAALITFGVGRLLGVTAFA